MYKNMTSKLYLRLYLSAITSLLFRIFHNICVYNNCTTTNYKDAIIEVNNFDIILNSDTQCYCSQWNNLGKIHKIPNNLMYKNQCCSDMVRQSGIYLGLCWLSGRGMHAPSCSFLQFFKIFVKGTKWLVTRAPNAWLPGHQMPGCQGTKCLVAKAPNVWLSGCKKYLTTALSKSVLHLLNYICDHHILITHKHICNHMTKLIIIIIIMI